MPGTRGNVVRFQPAGALRGSLQVPADKSISHRAAIIGALCSGPVTINNYLQAADTLSTLQALAACGVKVEDSGDKVTVHGAGLRGLKQPPDPIDVGNSGTTIRLLPGVLAGQRGRFVLDGDESIRKRPMDRVVEPLRRMGVSIEAREGRFAPLEITGGDVQGISYRMPMASAQVKSALLLAGLYAQGETRVTEPSLCRDHTEIMLSAAGAKVEKDGPETAIHPAAQLRLDQVTVPGDISSAAFLLLAATLVEGSEITITSVGINPTRTGFLDILEEMGADIETQRVRLESGEQVADLTVRSSQLHGAEVRGDISGRAIDELPLVAVAGAFARGDTIVSGAAELRVKESDRIAVMENNLGRLGVDFESRADGFSVRGSGLSGGDFDSRGDHRMAMLGAVAGIASREGVTVSGFESVNISYPGFLDALRSLGAEGIEE